MFVASPIGRVFVGPSFATWCFTPDLQGTFVWDKLDHRTMRDMMEIGRFVHHPAISDRRRSISDCSELARADADVLLDFVVSGREQLSAWSAGLERHALIVPEGVAGMMLSGALPMIGIEHSFRVVHCVDEAIEYIDHPAVARAHAAAAAIVAAHRGPSVLVARLRRQLANELNSATIERSATALGMSTRTLQRELNRLDTSYSDVLRRVRLEIAQQLLMETDLKIEAIATQVGFGNASRMSASMRRATNLTASEFRAARDVIDTSSFRRAAR